MRAASVAALSLAVTTFAQAVPEGIAPDESAPEGCEESSKYNFTVGYVGIPSKKRMTAMAEEGLQLTLKDGVLKDSYNRVGSIVANHQFQFDGPPQAGAIYTGGFSVCKNTSLALGGTTRWWKCGSGDFFNLYDQSIGGQCDEIRIVVSYVNMPSSASSSATASNTAEPSRASGSSSSIESTTPLTSVSGTVTSSRSSGFSSAPARATSSSGSTTIPDAPPNSAGGTTTARGSRREIFGAVVGILGAALIL